MFFFYGPWFFLGPFYLPIVFFVVKRDKSTLCRTNQIGPATDEVSNPKFHDKSAQAYFLSTLGSRKKVEWAKNYLFRWLSFQASIMSLRRFLRQSCRRTFRTSFVISRQLIEDIIAVKLHYCVLWRTGRKVVIEASSLSQWPWSYPRHWTVSLIYFLSRRCKHTALIIGAALFFWAIFRISYSGLRLKTLCHHGNSQVEVCHKAASWDPSFLMFLSMNWPTL